MKTHTLDVLGHLWTVKVLPKSRFTRRFGKATAGLTDTERKTLYLCSALMSSETTIHEIAHSYFSEVCVDSAMLDQAQMEEVACDLISKYGARILAQAKVVMEKCG